MTLLGPAAILGAVFTRIPCTVEISSSPEGHVAPSGDTVVLYGCTLDLVVIDAPGHVFQGWSTTSAARLATSPLSQNASFVIYGNALIGPVFTDTTGVDLNDPLYRVVRPNGGVVFTVGEVCSVQVASVRDANAMLFLVFGIKIFSVGSITRSFNPRKNSLFAFVIPEYNVNDIYSASGSQDTVLVSPVGKPCKILIQDYDRTTGYSDLSDSSFTIIGNSAIVASQKSYPKAFGMKSGGSGPNTYIKFWVPGDTFDGARDMDVSLYTIEGRRVAVLVSTQLIPCCYTVSILRSSQSTPLCSGLYVCVLTAPKMRLAVPLCIPR